MKIVKIFSWILRVIILILMIMLIIENLQTVTFNFFHIYSVTLPIIVIALIFLFIGMLIGLMVSLFKSFELKAKINLLEKELKKTTFTTLSNNRK